MTGPAPTESAEQRSRKPFPEWTGPVIIAVAFILAAVLTWRKWPDAEFDFGSQLYIPWQINHGALLYRDLYYFSGGPLSQYFNALLFRIFGVSLLTLVVSNLVATGLLLAIVYRRFRAAADMPTATVIGLAIVLAFAFAGYTPIGNYNYIAPYAHEALHGLLLSIIAISLLSDWISREKLRYAAAAGFCTGLVFLTKPELFLALAVTVAAAGLVFFLTRRPHRFLLRSGAVFLATTLIAPLLFFLYFLRLESVHDSFRGAVFAWLPALNPAVTHNPYYLWCMGLDDPAKNLWRIGRQSLGVVIIIAGCVALLRETKRSRSIWAAVGLWIAVLLWSAWSFNWETCGFALPLLSLGACALAGWNYKKEMSPVLAFPLLWSIFGLALLCKMGLLPRIWHYGFVLGMPAAVTAIYLLLRPLPELLEKKLAMPALPFRALAGLIVLIGLLNLFNRSQNIYAGKKLPVGHGSDLIYTFAGQDDIGVGTYAALGWIERYTPTNATISVMPEGVTFNYLTRRVTPSPCLDWSPTMLAFFGEQKTRQQFEEHPPDYVVLVSSDSFIYGVDYFGRDPRNGADLMRWIDSHYATAVLIGNEPLKDEHFGIKILRHLPEKKGANNN